MTIEKVHTHIDANRDNYLGEVKRLLTQPSISANGSGIRECAELVAGMMRATGIKTTIYATAGNPVVYGELQADIPAAKTVLFYGHYDVQPPEPLELWETPPFEPTVRNGRLFCRGVADNKGQLITHILAVRSYLAIAGKLPVNVKFIFEGEEESGSVNLPVFVADHKELLKADIVLPVDGSMLDGDIPNIRLGCRGIVNFEIRVTTGSFDNHSGLSGGVIPNAGWELLKLLNTMKDKDDNILIEGFHDDVEPPSAFELQVIDDLPFDAAATAKLYGVPALSMDKRDFFIKLNLKPSLTINGLVSGYQGKASKTVNPCTAVAKLDARLVNNQKPGDIIEKIKRHVAKHSKYAEVIFFGSMAPSMTDGSLPICQTVIQAMKKVYDNRVVLALGSGGSLPNAVWTDTLGIPALGLPYANADANNHAPNENVKVALIHKGIHASAQIIHDLGQMK
jgi:Acetylornithine deacetylase/Succinyl-diaminopimelate desuccinylase and related deacylases